MQTSVFQTWSIRIVTFAVAALATGSAAWWALALSNTATWQPSVSVAPAAQLDVSVLAQALGAGAAPSSAVPEVAPLAIQLLGVVTGADGKGLALMAVGGAPPKTYKVGSQLAEGLVLQSVRTRSAQLGAQMKGQARQTLELPPLSTP